MTNKFENSLQYAQKLDASDPLKTFRNEFHIPNIEKRPSIYFCGNSLGLQPKGANDLIQQELHDWAILGVEGHIKAKNAWVDYHKMFSQPLATLTGAYPHEVIAMNTLTTNLHLMLTTFYRPNSTRYKIITEAGSFSSDIYALESQVKLHGLDPKKCIIEIKPRTEEYLIRHEDILKEIEIHSKELCLILIGGVNYYTGQKFDMKAITAAAHKAGAYAGFDLAHAIGNVELQMHLWEVDFAVWCSYKYLNSGPGGVGGLYIHERHGKNKKLPRLAGWWGHEEKTKFLMPRDFSPSEGAEGFQLSNAPIFSMAVHKAALNIFESAGIKKIIAKSKLLTNYLEFLLTTQCNIIANNEEGMYFQIKIITPANESERGAQLSIMIMNNGKLLHDKLTQQGIVVDWRSPSVIRVSPAPLYNSFEEVYRFGKIVSETCCHI